MTTTNDRGDLGRFTPAGGLLGWDTLIGFCDTALYSSAGLVTSPDAATTAASEIEKMVDLTHERVFRTTSADASRNFQQLDEGATRIWAAHGKSRQDSTNGHFGDALRPNRRSY